MRLVMLGLLLVAMAGFVQGQGFMPPNGINVRGGWEATPPPLGGFSKDPSTTAPAYPSASSGSTDPRDARREREMACFRWCDQNLNCHPNDPNCMAAKLGCRSKCFED
jgi:hypothetical protein